MMTSNNSPKVAVLIAAYNGMHWIEEQVNSIFAQKGVNVTLFFSVDLSTDGTDQWVKKLAQEHSNVIMLKYGERFGGAGPNFFRLIRDVDFSGYDAISFSDQDDIWFHDKLFRACTFLHYGGYDVYSSNVLALWQDGKCVLIDKAQPQKRFDYFFEAGGAGCTYVFNIDVALALKCFVIQLDVNTQTILLHDWVAYAFCRHNGFKWWIDPEPSVYYRQHERNQVGANRGFEAFKSRFVAITQKNYRKQVLAITAEVEPAMNSRFSSPLFLIHNFMELRRRPRDRLFLLLCVLLGLF